MLCHETGFSRILLKRCIEKDDRELLQHVSQCFEGIKVETAKWQQVLEPA